jgi:hypothetical protein
MSVKELAVSAAELAGTQIAKKGANKAVQSLSNKSPNKFKALILMASAVMLFMNGVRMFKNKPPL